MPGIFRADLPTPALFHLAALPRNVAAIAAWVRDYGRAIRPQTKVHKCLEIASTVYEADAMLELGPCRSSTSRSAAPRPRHSTRSASAEASPGTPTRPACRPEPPIPSTTRAPCPEPASAARRFTVESSDALSGADLRRRSVAIRMLDAPSVSDLRGAPRLSARSPRRIRGAAASVPSVGRTLRNGAP